MKLATSIAILILLDSSQAYRIKDEKVLAQIREEDNEQGEGTKVEGATNAADNAADNSKQGGLGANYEWTKDLVEGNTLEHTAEEATEEDS